MKTRKLWLAAMMLIVALSVSAASPRYIFYFIGDGMGMGQVSATQCFNRMVLGNDKPLLMMQFPVASAAFTHSASSPVTDSAAAGTALATGHKTVNGMLGVTPDSVAVTSIARVLKDDGFGIGLVTTVAPDDATPGAFYAHVPYRGMFYEIGKDAAASGYEFIAGANLRGTKNADGTPNDLLEVLANSGVAVVRGLDALKETSSRRVMLLNTNEEQMNNVGYVIDSIAGVLTLPDMTRACIDHLMTNTPDKFFMMVEGGTIDHAGHSNDAATVVMETLGFDESLRVAYDFYLAHPEETLIVVTADHETGGMALGNNRLGYNAKPEVLTHVRMSKDAFSDWCRGIIKSRMVFTWDDMKHELAERTGLYGAIPVSEAENEKLEAIFNKVFEQRNSTDTKTLYNTFNEFVVEVYAYISSESGIGWTTGSHSGALVPVYAIGVDAQRFSALMDNTEIPGKILSIVLGK